MTRTYAAKIILLLLPLALLSALLLWQLWPRPANPLAVRARDVSCIVLERDDWLSDEQDGLVTLEDPAEIQAFCDVWNGEWATEVQPYANDVIDGTLCVATHTGESEYLWVEIHLENGERRRYSLMGDYIFSYPAEGTDRRFYFHMGYTLEDWIAARVAAGAS